MWIFSSIEINEDNLDQTSPEEGEDSDEVSNDGIVIRDKSFLSIILTKPLYSITQGGGHFELRIYKFCLYFLQIKEHDLITTFAKESEDNEETSNNSSERF